MNARQKRRESGKHGIAVFLVDDHPLVRRGVSELINGETDMHVCGEADTAEIALRTLADQPADVVLVDLRLPGMDGLELTKRIKQRRADTRVLVLTMHEDITFADRALRAGASGYVNKQEDPQRLVQAIRDVAGGRVAVNAEVAGRLLEGLVRGEESGSADPVHALTDRELEVFALIGRGQTPREIAERLHLSIKTIEAHRDRIRKKIGARNTADLIRRAVQWVLENG